MTSIYVASSWRNELQPGIVRLLRSEGHAVYDFRNPAPGNDGFKWTEVAEKGKDWKTWTPHEYRIALKHPVAQKGFLLDIMALGESDECCLVLPCGRSAHLEAGIAIGKGKRTSIYIPSQQGFEPELMYLAGGIRTKICLNMTELLEFHGKKPQKRCKHCDCILATYLGDLEMHAIGCPNIPL